MKYALYLALMYIFIPLNNIVDFIAIMIFIAAMTENGYFAIVYAFCAGLLIDLYYPSLLGVNIIMYVLLVQVVLYLRRYVAQSPGITFGMFAVFFLMKVTIHHTVIAFPFRAPYIILTLVCFFPIFVLLNKILHRVWMKTS